MQAELKKFEGGCIARFERHLKYSVAKVWSYLTENELLKTWFSELHIDELREGGKIKFDMQDGTFEAFTILELKKLSVLEFTWGSDQVRFELHKNPEGCLLVLEETIKTITNHTPKDLAGWHVCLDVIAALLDDETIERDKEWKKWYPKYVEATNQIIKSEP
ncbi:SRPBCC family protein [Shimazuella kribbensis]|uniref:SRPBCC family protein n=1 Tax=Shimazuella kribbensis TaxID=139808 RepID=UPI00040E6C83|nr:SRPBCC family protein [Shimazuella kribbensis]